MMKLVLMTHPIAPWRHAKPVIGLLGGPGAGKSSVARLFEREGCAVIDADALAKEALDEPTVRAQVAAWWGPKMLDESGRVDRQALGRVVFASAEPTTGKSEKLRRLEALLHPKVDAKRAALRRDYERNASVRAIIEDCPLLLETGLDERCDVLVFVATPREIRLQRLKKARGWDERELAKREKNQLTLDIKRKRAHYAVDNSADQATALRSVRHVLSRTFEAIQTKH